MGDALRTVADVPTARHFVHFNRPAAAGRANVGAAHAGPYALAPEWAATELMTAPSRTRTALGIDPLGATFQLSVGDAGATAGVLSGLDLHSLGPRLTAYGAAVTRDGASTTYRLPVNSLGQNDKLAAALTAAFDLTVMQTRGSVVRFGRSAQVLATVNAGRESLATDPDFAAVAGCLGEPLAADLTDALATLVRQRRADGEASPAPGIRVVGVGLTGAAGQAPTDEMCARTATAAQAHQVAATMRHALAAGRSQGNGKYWRDMLLTPVVQVSGSTVRLTGHPPKGGAGGLLLTGLENGADLPGVGGT